MRARRDAGEHDGTKITATLTAVGVTLVGGAGDDVLTGGAGNDALNGEVGNDSLTAADGVRDSSTAA